MPARLDRWNLDELESLLSGAAALAKTLHQTMLDGPGGDLTHSDLTDLAALLERLTKEALDSHERLEIAAAAHEMEDGIAHEAGASEDASERGAALERLGRLRACYAADALGALDTAMEAMLQDRELTMAILPAAFNVEPEAGRLLIAAAYEGDGRLLPMSMRAAYDLGLIKPK